MYRSFHRRRSRPKGTALVCAGGRRLVERQVDPIGAGPLPLPVQAAALPQLGGGGGGGLLPVPPPPVPPLPPVGAILTVNTAVLLATVPLAFVTATLKTAPLSVSAVGCVM